MTIANRSKRTIGTRAQRAINKAAKKQLHNNLRAVDAEVTRTGLEYAAMVMNALHDHTPVITPPANRLISYSFTEQIGDGWEWPAEHTYVLRCNAENENNLSHIIPVTYKARGHLPRTELLCNAHRVTFNQEWA